MLSKEINMTPLQMARAECPNLESDTCTGVTINDDLTLAKSTDSKICLLGGNARCRYFETTVAPMAEYQTDAKKAASYQDAVFSYRSKHPDMYGTTRKCPDCGKPIFKQDRFCPVCSKERRRNTQKQADKKRRSVIKDSLPTVS